MSEALTATLIDEEVIPKAAELTQIIHAHT